MAKFKATHKLLYDRDIRIPVMAIGDGVWIDRHGQEFRSGHFVKVAAIKPKAKTVSGFGARLRQARERCGYTQEEAAKRAKVQSAAWSHFETGKREPNIYNLKAICLAVGISADYLIGIKDDAYFT